MMRFGRVLSLGIVGSIVGLAWSHILESGYTEQWLELPSPPSAASEFLAVFDGTLFIKTLDGSVWQCSSIRNQCWTQGHIPENYQDWTEVTMPCDFSSSEFSFLSNHPKNITACIQGVTQYAEGIGRETYALDADGIIWEWRYTFAGLAPLYAAYAPIFCPAIGVVVGLVSLLIRRRRSVLR